MRLEKSTGDVSITNCIFQNNSATSGGAVLFYESQGNVSITYCKFQNNSATVAGGAVYFFKSQGDVSITYCTFQNNSATGGGAVRLERSTGNVSVTYCTFQNNSATGGGAVLFYESQTNVGITNCTFENNSGTDGGGTVIMNFGTAVAFGAVKGRSLNYVVTNCTFTKNSAYNGAAVYVTNNVNAVLVYLHLQDVVIKDNHSSRGGAIYFDGVKVDIFGNTPTGSQFSSNSAQGAIQGQNGLLLLHGNITFTENRGVNGGAISLSNNAPLYFYEGCRVEFSRNVALDLVVLSTMMGR